MYYLGKAEGYKSSMENVCGKIKETTELPLANDANFVASEIPWLQACADRAWEKWQNRENAGWCAHCGISANSEGKLYKCCGDTTSKRVLYCSADHAKYDRKLHKFTCEWKEEKGRSLTKRKQTLA